MSSLKHQLTIFFTQTLILSMKFASGQNLLEEKVLEVTYLQL